MVKNRVLWAVLALATVVLWVFGARPYLHLRTVPLFILLLLAVTGGVVMALVWADREDVKS